MKDTKARRTCKKCNNTYGASAFATRTGFICKWCKGAGMLVNEAIRARGKE